MGLRSLVVLLLLGLLLTSFSLVFAEDSTPEVVATDASKESDAAAASSTEKAAEGEAEKAAENKNDPKKRRTARDWEKVKLNEEMHKLDFDEEEDKKWGLPKFMPPQSGFYFVTMKDEILEADKLDLGKKWASLGRSAGLELFAYASGPKELVVSSMGRTSQFDILRFLLNQPGVEKVTQDRKDFFPGMFKNFPEDL